MKGLEAKDMNAGTREGAGPALAGVLFVIAGTAFITVTMLAASIAPGYDDHDGNISDLGVLDATALLFNASLVAIGLLNAVGGWLAFGASRHARLVAIYVLAGIGAIGAGIFPLDTGTIHAVFALIAFVLFNVEALATAAVMRGTFIRPVSALAGLVGLVFVAIMLVGDGGNPDIFGAIGHGGAERMIAYPVMLWLVAFGGHLSAAAGASKRAIGTG
jgi:hypothetical membrane protein